VGLGKTSYSEGMNKAPLRSDTTASLLRRHMRAVVHMRQQKASKQFGLVFGAGIGKDLGFPKWDELIGRIAEKVNGVDLKERARDSSTVSQLLYQHYRAEILKKEGAGGVPSRMQEMQVRAGWRAIVHECLYRGLPTDLNDLLANDRYLEAYAPVIKQSPLTVTYNFDDTIEKILKKHRSVEESESKGYTTYWSGNVQLNARSGGVVYHPNGYLPRNLKERPSDHLVFLEDSFLDQLIDSMAGQYASLSTHISRTTCLFVGLSLDDPGLKHLLRQSAKAFPGHYQYYVRFVQDDAKTDEQSRLLEVAGNFDVYNLITLHLTRDELNALATLLTTAEADFQAYAEEIGPTAYRYYVVGSVAAGKSTTVGHFRSLMTQDEWLEERAPGMEKDPSLLNPEEEAEIDKWVADQVARKNVKLEKTSQTGIHVIDRAPPDALAFTHRDKWKEKAALLRSRISPGQATARRVVPGHVIFLEGDPEVMACRAVSLHKATDHEKLKNQQDTLWEVYGKLTPHKGVSKVDVRERSVAEVVKIVAKIIFLTPYVEADLQAGLVFFEENGYVPLTAA
jgi:hypothetical protein